MKPEIIVLLVYAWGACATCATVAGLLRMRWNENDELFVVYALAWPLAAIMGSVLGIAAVAQWVILKARGQTDTRSSNTLADTAQEER